MAIEELAKLIQDLNRFNFSNIPQEVLGAVFEKLIPPEERHRLGQYFTREDLVDFINAFCIRTRDDHILDPTCGTGTFLTRAYDRMKIYGQREHRKLLSQLWGVDIALFPAELATINLFRQDLSDYANFPRILPKDFFEIKVGQTFQFPPPKASLNSQFTLIEEEIPIFDAAVGNFPYIRQELINRQEPGYKDFLEKTLAEEWLIDYPDAFVIPLSGQADIYAYLFFHTGRFIREGGRMGFVTSNAWLDVGYGYELQRFLLNNFKLIAILESRCEPWFEGSAINTIVTIVERCSSKEERDDHLVKFVKVKRKLSELIPWDMKLEAMERWFGIDALVYRIEGVGKEHYKLQDERIVNTLKGLKTYEDKDFRIRVVKQEELLAELEKEGKTSKWGKYLRAPEVYFEILDKCKDKLVPLKEVADIRRGYTTGVNEFFYLSKDRIRHWGIENEFLAPVIKSPKESGGILIDLSKLELKVFLCHKSKEELLREGKMRALRYIEWGEQQRDSGGTLWCEHPTVVNRKYWYALPTPQLTKILWTKSYDVRFLQRYSKERLHADQRVYQLLEKDGAEAKLLATVLNSSLCSLIIELCGRVNLGEGALDTTVEEAQEYMLVPNPQLFKGKVKDDAVQAFDNLCKRPIKPIFEEVKMKDRQRLDRLVLKTLGLDPKQYLKPIYDGLTQLVRERIELANMRKGVKQVKTQRDIEKLKKQVTEEVLPYGVRKFPEEFLDLSLKAKDFAEVSVPGEPLKLGMYFLGTQEVITDSGFTYQAKTVEEAKYLIYAQKPDSFVIKIPKDTKAVAKAVNNYERYLRQLKAELFQAFLNRIFDHKISDALAQRVLIEFKLSSQA